MNNNTHTPVGPIPRAGHVSYHTTTNPSRVPGQPRPRLLAGRRAMVADLRADREAVIVAYPSDGEFAVVHFDGDLDPITVHKSRVKSVLSC